MKIDWSRPIVAVDMKTGSRIAAGIAKDFSRNHPGVPVRLPRNVWTAEGDGGVWYFNDDGLAVAGVSPDGYNGRFRLENAA